MMMVMVMVMMMMVMVMMMMMMRSMVGRALRRAREGDAGSDVAHAVRQALASGRWGDGTGWAL